MGKFEDFVHPTHASCSLGVLFRQFGAPRDFQEDFIFGSHRRQVIFFPMSFRIFHQQIKESRLVVSDVFRKVAFWFPSFMLEPNRHNRATPNVTVFFTPNYWPAFSGIREALSPPCRPSKSPEAKTTVAQPR